MDIQAFYSSIRSSLFSGKIKENQVQGINAILAGYNQSEINSLQQLAYILATVYHETGRTMQPVEESGRGKGYDYGRKLKRGQGPGKRIPYTTPNQLYYGRGLVQLTWYENYEAMGKIIGVDLLNHPELLFNMSISVQVLLQGMIHGYFTGKKLSDYINHTKTDFIGARNIINGNDQAGTIAGYAAKFYAALIL